MSKVLEKNDNLILLEVLNQDFAEELKLILKLVSRIKDNSPHLKVTKEKRIYFFKSSTQIALLNQKRRYW
jgi:hypothetical protein